MSGVATAIGVSSAIGAISSSSAANKQKAAAGEANAVAREQLEYQKQLNKPYHEAGTRALTKMEDPSFQKDFTRADFKTSPGYNFALEQGQNAINAMNSATGNTVSGAGLAALSKYNTGMADQSYQQAFNNFQTNTQNKFGRLSNIAGMGQGAASNSGLASNYFTKTASENTLGAGNAGAAGDMASANALSRGVTGLAGAFGGMSAGTDAASTAGFTNADTPGASSGRSMSSFAFR
jgi:hypothetical protein